MTVNGEESGDVATYNLKGQRLQEPARGINAVKGRLFIKK